MNFLEKKRLKFNNNAFGTVIDDPYKLEFIDKENQKEEISLIAIKENGFLIKHVKNITPKICLEAVKQIMGRDFEDEYEKELMSVVRENSNETLEIVIDGDGIRLYSVDRKISIWEGDVTEITLARVIFNEYSERVLKELEIKIYEGHKSYILDELEYHRECLINGDVVIEKCYDSVLTIECDCCNETIVDSDFFDY